MERTRHLLSLILPPLLIAGAAHAPLAQNAEPAAVPGTAQLVDDPSNRFVPSVDMPLFLLVIVNGKDTGLVAEFTLHATNGAMSSTAGELREVGLEVDGAEGRTVYLDEIPGLSYRYDEVGQIIDITAAHSQLAPQEISAVVQPEIPEPQPGFGAVLNYGLTGNLGSDLLADGFELASVGGQFEGRVYTPFGVLTSTHSASFADGSLENGSFRRQETTFTWSSPKRMLTFSAGDVLSSGPKWSRPVRLGGIQLRRDFSLRSDVINTPLLTYRGAAALPSTVDVYVDNVRAWSGAVEPGPFVLTDLPMITSRGEARVMIRDEEGSERVARVPFFAARNLLKQGKLDFSLEAGRAREAYGLSDFQYDDATLWSASARYGLTDKLTLEGHVEGSADLLMGGFGLTATPFNLAEVTLAGGASQTDGRTGQFAHGRFRTEFMGARVNLETFRSFGDFSDLAYVTGVSYLGETKVAENVTGLLPPEAQDSLSISFPKLWDGAGLSVGLVNSERASEAQTILSASYSQRFDRTGGSLRASAFESLRGDGGFGVSLGMSIPFGSRGQASANFSGGNDARLRATASLSRPIRSEAGSLGYRLDLASQEGKLTGSGRVEYRSRYGQVGLRLRDTGRGVSGAASLSGSLVAAGGGLFAGNRISDSFAVVKVGVPGVDVKLHNQTVTRTGPFGRALVPDLRAYRNNRVSIDPEDLPLNASVEATSMDVVPARKSGVAVIFGSGVIPSALVVVRDAEGGFLPVGASVRLNEGNGDFIVGYDGEVWLEGLKPSNRIEVQLPEGTCQATFPYTPSANEQIVIDNVECL